MNILFSKSQNELFQKLKELNKESLSTWYIFNLIIPGLIILIPAMLWSFLPENRLSYQNLILNGSFSLLGINILFSMSTYLINSIKLTDQKVEDQITEIRKRLVIYLGALLMFGTIFYIVQIAFNIMESTARYITTTIGCFALLIVSVIIGKSVYLLKGELVGKAYNEEVIDKVENLKKAVNDLE